MKALRWAALLLPLAANAILAQAAVAQSFGFGQEMRDRGRGAPPPKEGETMLNKIEKRFPIGQSWVAVSLNGKAFTGTQRPAFTLDDQFRVRGFGGCNTFATTAFPLREQGIAVGPLAVTKKACPAPIMASEHAFLVAIRTAAKWDTVRGSLILKSQAGEIRFERSL